MAGLPLFLAGCETAHDRMIHDLAFGELNKDAEGNLREWNVKMPPAKVVRGRPSYLDFGDGVHVPLTKGAFFTLWEGTDYWLTYGVGWTGQVWQSKEHARMFATATMKLLLLTLAFAPERMEQKDRGWRLKVQDVKNYVRGALDLPGRPFTPLIDTQDVFGGYSESFALAQNAMMSAGGMPGGAPLFRFGAFGDDKIAAACTYLIPKRDLSLADVRKYAVLDTPGVGGQK